MLLHFSRVIIIVVRQHDEGKSGDMHAPFFSPLFSKHNEINEEVGRSEWQTSFFLLSPVLFFP